MGGGATSGYVNFFYCQETFSKCSKVKPLPWQGIIIFRPVWRHNSIWSGLWKFRLWWKHICFALNNKGHIVNCSKSSQNLLIVVQHFLISKNRRLTARDISYKVMKLRQICILLLNISLYLHQITLFSINYIILYALE